MPNYNNRLTPKENDAYDRARAAYPQFEEAASWANLIKHYLPNRNAFFQGEMKTDDDSASAFSNYMLQALAKQQGGTEVEGIYNKINRHDAPMLPQNFLNHLASLKLKKKSSDAGYWYNADTSNLYEDIREQMRSNEIQPEGLLGQLLRRLTNTNQSQLRK